MTLPAMPTEQLSSSEVSRRSFAGLLGGSSVLLIAGCGGGSVTSASADGAGGGTTTTLPPVISTQPQLQSAVVGATATFSVTASGSNLSYQWRRNGVALSGATSASLVVTVTTADAGAQYSVVVSNASGQVESLGAVLTLMPVAMLSLLAGAFGSEGYFEGKGRQARLTRPRYAAVTKDGVVFFSDGSAQLGQISAQGDVSFISQSFAGISVGGIACDSKGGLYVSAIGIGVIYKLINNVFTVFAGEPQPFPGGDFLDGVGSAARLKLPRSPVFDGQDNLFFVDAANHAIRKIAPNGTVSTIAGGPANLTLVDGKGSAAGFADPSLLLSLSDGSLLVLDSNRWRKVLPDGTVSTLSGTVPAVTAVVGTAPNSLYALLGNSVVKLALDGTTTLVAGNEVQAGYVEGVKDAARFNAPAGLTLSGTGQLFVADQKNAMIRRVDPLTGLVSGWAGAAPQPGRVDGLGSNARFTAMGASCLDRDGNVYVIDIEAEALRKITPSGVASTPFNNFPSDGGVAVDAAGNFYGVRNRAIIKVSPTGAQSIWAGQPGILGFADGQGTSASFARPMALLVDIDGTLFVGDSPDVVTLPFRYFSTYTFGTTIRKITPNGLVSTVAGVVGRTFKVGYEPESGVNLLPTPDITFVQPWGLASDGKGTIWAGDRAGVRRIDGKGGEPVWMLKTDSTFFQTTGNSGRPGGFEYFTSGTMIAYAPGSQGDVYVAGGAIILKVRADGSQIVVVGTSTANIGIMSPNIGSVQLGVLPASVGTVTAVVAASADVLYCCSENSVLKVQLA